MNCEQLDNYLCRLLPPAQAAAFEQHAAACVACRTEIEQTRRLFDTLQAAVETLEPCPPRLMAAPSEKTTTIVPPSPALKRRRRSAFPLVLSLSAVAALSLVMLPERTGPGPADSTITEHSADALPQPEVSLPEGVIGLPIESSDPNIRIVMLYNLTPDDPENPVYQLPE